MGCSRCGSEGHTEYAPNGQSYCSSCSFYGMNKPCWKCQMYLPSSELQMYRGQLTCQYCMMDLRDAERHTEERHTEERHTEERHEERREESPKKPYAGRSEEAHLAHVPEDERCDRCRRKLSIVYIFNNRRLCEICIEREKDEWETKGSGATPMVLRLRVRGKESLLSRLIHKLEIMISQIVDSKRGEPRVKPGQQKEEKKDEGEGGGDAEAKTEEGTVKKPPEKKKKGDLEFEKYFDDAKNDG